MCRYRYREICLIKHSRWKDSLNKWHGKHMEGGCWMRDSTVETLVYWTNKLIKNFIWIRAWTPVRYGVTENLSTLPTVLGYNLFIHYSWGFDLKIFSQSMAQCMITIYDSDVIYGSNHSMIWALVTVMKSGSHVKSWNK